MQYAFHYQYIFNNGDQSPKKCKTFKSIKEIMGFLILNKEVPEGYMHYEIFPDQI
jgi:hypothetical protein